LTLLVNSGAAVRLAESIAHQLCLAAASGRPCIAVVVGSALPDVPVVLADLPDAPWSFTAEPSLRPAAGLHSAIG